MQTGEDKLSLPYLHRLGLFLDNSTDRSIDSMFLSFCNFEIYACQPTVKNSFDKITQLHCTNNPYLPYNLYFCIKGIGFPLLLTQSLNM